MCSLSLNEGAVKPLMCRPNVPSMSKKKQEPPLPMPFQLPAPSLTADMELQNMHHTCMYSFPRFIFRLSLAASQMWCLGRFFPILIGDLVPEEHCYWKKLSHPPRHCG